MVNKNFYNKLVLFAKIKFSLSIYSKFSAPFSSQFSFQNNSFKNNIWEESSLMSAHKLANMYIKRGEQITATEVNTILTFSGIKITQNELDNILKKPFLEFNNLDLNTIKSEKFFKFLGTVRSKSVPGIYIWTHLASNSKYVGSSSSLARRLIGYFKGTHETIGKLIPLIKKEGVQAFSLKVLCLTESYSKNQEHSLEQYFLLHSEFNLNTLKVVNDVSGARAKSLFMYSKDLSELIYSSDIQEDFIFKLGIHHSTFTNSLKTGEIYLNKYIFTSEFINEAKHIKKSETEIKAMLEKDRLEYLKIKNVIRKVIIKSINDNNITKSFDTISDCVAYLNTIAPSNKSTLYRRIESRVPYHGWICEWGGEETTHIRDKAVQVNVTNILSNETLTYSSMREAALSLAPEYITTGPTIKAYANSGKIFKEKYLFTYSKK
jgi:hypothetical protein